MLNKPSLPQTPQYCIIYTALYALWINGSAILREAGYGRTLKLDGKTRGIASYSQSTFSVFHKHRRPEISPATGLSVSGYIFVNLKK